GCVGCLVGHLFMFLVGGKTPDQSVHLNLTTTPVARGESRLYMQRIEKDWYSLMNTIQSGTAAQADAARKQLREELLAIAPVFTQKPYFLSDEFSLVDCYLAPLLWRLPVLGVELVGAGAKELKGYMTRVFERDSFLASLTEAEREMRLGRG
ncbi:glutathione binding-like protein, partial [Klebsiella pneumoniae]|uniref:glutathione binding-like protein n=1 Tax=Klebsiella pneumoniae TaxID=573 RepID=UPI0021687187